MLIGIKAVASLFSSLVNAIPNTPSLLNTGDQLVHFFEPHSSIQNAMSVCSQILFWCIVTLFPLPSLLPTALNEGMHQYVFSSMCQSSHHRYAPAKSQFLKSVAIGSGEAEFSLPQSTNTSARSSFSSSGKKTFFILFLVPSTQTMTPWSRLRQWAQVATTLAFLSVSILKQTPILNSSSFHSSLDDHVTTCAISSPWGLRPGFPCSFVKSLNSWIHLWGLSLLCRKCDMGLWYFIGILLNIRIIWLMEVTHFWLSVIYKLLYLMSDFLFIGIHNMIYR